MPCFNEWCAYDHCASFDTFVQYNWQTLPERGWLERTDPVTPLEEWGEPVRLALYKTNEQPEVRVDYSLRHVYMRFDSARFISNSRTSEFKAVLSRIAAIFTESEKLYLVTKAISEGNLPDLTRRVLEPLNSALLDPDTGEIIWNPHLVKDLPIYEALLCLFDFLGSEDAERVPSAIHTQSSLKPPDLPDAPVPEDMMLSNSVTFLASACISYLLRFFLDIYGDFLGDSLTPQQYPFQDFKGVTSKGKMRLKKSGYKAAVLPRRVSRKVIPDGENGSEATWSLFTNPPRIWLRQQVLPHLTNTAVQCQMMLEGKIRSIDYSSPFFCTENVQQFCYNITKALDVCLRAYELTEGSLHVLSILERFCSNETLCHVLIQSSFSPVFLATMAKYLTLCQKYPPNGNCCMELLLNSVYHLCTEDFDGRVLDVLAVPAIKVVNSLMRCCIPGETRDDAPQYRRAELMSRMATLILNTARKRELILLLDFRLLGMIYCYEAQELINVEPYNLNYYRFLDTEDENQKEDVKQQKRITKHARRAMFASLTLLLVTIDTLETAYHKAHPEQGYSNHLLVIKRILQLPTPDFVRSIELLYRGKPYTVYFAKLHRSRELNPKFVENVRRNLKQGVKRYTQVVKTKNFIVKSMRVMMAMWLQRYLLTRPWWWRWIPQHDMVWWFMTYSTALALNLCLLLGYNRPNGIFPDNAPILDDDLEKPLFVLGIIHLVFYLLALISWASQDLWLSITYWKKKHLYEQEYGTSTKTKDQMYWVRKLIYGTRIPFHVTYSLCGLIGLTWSWLFYAGNAFLLVMGLKTPVKVMRALGTKAGFTGSVIVMACAMIYMYSIIAFRFLQETYEFGDGRAQWRRFGGFFLSHLDYGFRSPPVWYDGLDLFGHQIYPQHFGYVLFSISYYFTVVLIFGAIISGIVIDTFGEVRERQEFIAQDNLSKCFICGISAEEFDKYHSDGFREHTIREHNIWDYLHYLESLLDCQFTDMSPLDKAVRKHYPWNALAFMPVMRSIALEVKAGLTSGTNSTTSMSSNNTIPESKLDTISLNSGIVNTEPQVVFQKNPSRLPPSLYAATDENLSLLIEPPNNVHMENSIATMATTPINYLARPNVYYFSGGPELDESIN